MDNGFSFGGKATWDFPRMRVERYPSAPGAVRKHKTYSVPGRNGDLHSDEGAYQNYTQSYAVYFHGDRPTNEEAHKVKTWLLGAAGYQRLVDAYDPTHYRRAMVTGGLDITNHCNKYGKFTINFDCDPRSFLISGDDPVEFSAPGMISNPTAYTALPLITVRGNGTGSVSVNGITVEIRAISGSIILDCETQNAYSVIGEAAENENGNIYAPEFPGLSPGENGVAFSGGITAVSIVPRWWEV